MHQSHSWPNVTQLLNSEGERTFVHQKVTSPLRGKVQGHTLESLPQCACYFTLGHHLLMKQGWWWSNQSGSYQCHCTESFQEMIPIQKNDASMLDLLLMKNTKHRGCSLGSTHLPSVSQYLLSVYKVLTLQSVLGNTSLNPASSL